MTVTIAQRGLFYDELRTDVVYQHSPGRTLDVADNTLFSTLTMNPQSLHLDADASAATEFGQRLVNSMLTLSTLIGLSVGQLTQATTIANLGFGAVRFPNRFLPVTRCMRRHRLSTSDSRPLARMPASSSSSTWAAISTARPSPWQHGRP
jgi:hypothetical protein